ncbi:hypothetical protein G7062_05210 [Erysipelothrix sp. HDW6C]|uniref:hypothetical protein n=1 Tax=Erysipelothrix sp. HDW6C TaxID=2714930 RepID=UPI00140B1BD1|nr:hypothetical protein [Erysipelothrix sp. HDW6C]QIK69730.1 hypothetical protein G7062_05210 [Erysipelothrix sp. HDW6C]
MNRQLRIGICAIGAIALVFVGLPFAFGWIIGWSALIALAYFRHKFYNIILDEKQFTVKKYISYIIFVFIILWMPLLLAFLFPKIINPFAMAATYIIDRLLFFITGIFSRGPTI